MVRILAPDPFFGSESAELVVPSSQIVVFYVHMIVFWALLLT
jgi:hypothetical protein